MGRRRKGRRRLPRLLLPVLPALLLLLLLLPSPPLLRPVPPPDREAEARVLAALPPDLEPTRRTFVLTACSLVGRVGYFWGGKSESLGWDRRWGVPAVVTAPGGPGSGESRPFGLDCSGYVTWTAVNTAGTAEGRNAVGDGVRAQYTRCRPVGPEEVLPGDLAFFPDLSHVGIVASREADGSLLVLHCSHSLGGVVLSVDAAAVGFTLFGIPDYGQIRSAIPP